MGIDVRQLLLLAVAVVVPLVLLRRKQYQLLLGWVCLTLFVQIFDTVIITNLPAARIVGLMYLPTAVESLRHWSRLSSVRTVLLNLLYLTVLGLFFGFIWQWPDITHSRPFTLTAPGRTIIYLVRTVSDISLAAFIAWQVTLPGALRMAGRAIVIGSTLNALAGMLYFATGFDLCYQITGQGESLVSMGRARGLAIEPRAMGLVCVYGLMVLLIARSRLHKWWPVPLLLNLIGLLLTYSASSLVLFLVGLVTAGLFFAGRIKLLVLATALAAVVIIAATWLLAPGIFETGLQTVQLRVAPEYKLSGIASGTMGQEIAYRMDVFDASALLFLLDQPLYALFGTGPGLVSLPASEYVPPGLYSLIWTPETGINSLPSHGLLLEISNSGLPGLILWGWLIMVCLTALRQMRKLTHDTEHQGDWEFAWAFYLVGVVFHLVQVSHTPVWSLTLGIGWAATILADLVSRQEFQFASAGSAEVPAWQPDYSLSGD